ncbi:hypothetical protein PVK06_040680 [Gossypium arboreum]|uniref:Uncharacterized protein n=1 Tax=Gossypium arboreum TaxID=29729 RepID=A0ABR0N639_GOSAR|nr:hypothetical protein PVK06_040680 [Gossypium arboreum]
MPLEPRASWFSPKCVEAQQLTGHLGGSRSASETMGDKLHRREGNSPDHQLRPLNDRSVIKEVGVQRQPGGERSALGGSTRVSGSRRSGSENVGLSNANIGENPMPRKPKGSSARVRRGRENAPSQCSSTRRYGAEVTHAILPGKARTTFNKRCRKVKEVGDLMTGEPATEAPVNGGRNYNGPKASQKVTEACKGFLGPDGDWPSSAKAEGSLTARPTRRAGTKVGLSDPTVPSGRAVAQRIKVTLGITG